MEKFQGNDTIIIGLGTGRCGTVSLARFLSAQFASVITHEGGNIRPRPSDRIMAWEGDEEKVLRYIDKFIISRFGKRCFFSGDVGSYYLPYVDIIYHKYNTHYNVKFVCIKRKKEDVIKSFIEKVSKGNRNHWINHDGIRWNLDPIRDKWYPKYNVSTIEEALDKYWDDYDSKSNDLQRKYPQDFRVYNIENLNSTEGRKKILDFIGLPKNKQSLTGSFVYNKSRKSGKRGNIPAE